MTLKASHQFFHKKYFKFNMREFHSLVLDLTLIIACKSTKLLNKIRGENYMDRLRKMVDS